MAKFQFIIFHFIFVTLLQFTVSTYSSSEDLKVIKQFYDKSVPPKNHAKVARKLVHKSNWAATGTISTIKEIKGFPMVNIISIADSEKDAASTGDIYFLLTMLDFTGQDIKQNNKITFLISDDEDLSCTHNNHTDPMEPTCARVILSGKVRRLNPDMEEYNFGLKAVISRHPAAENWLKAHTFFLCKLDIKDIFVLDWYGGPHNISVEEYYNTSPDEKFNNVIEFKKIKYYSTPIKNLNIKIRRRNIYTKLFV